MRRKGRPKRRKGCFGNSARYFSAIVSGARVGRKGRDWNVGIFGGLKMGEEM